MAGTLIDSKVLPDSFTEELMEPHPVLVRKGEIGPCHLT